MVDDGYGVVVIVVGMSVLEPAAEAVACVTSVNVEAV